MFVFRESAVFSCLNESCNDEMSKNVYISVHVAGASEASTVGGEFTCYTCGSQLVEDVSCRTLTGYECDVVDQFCFTGHGHASCYILERILLPCSFTFLNYQSNLVFMMVSTSWKCTIGSLNPH